MSTTTTQTIQANGQAISLAALQPANDAHVPARTPAQTSVPAPDAVSIEAAATPISKLLVAGFSFFCAGVNDGTLGALVPYIISSFGIGTGEIAIMYVVLTATRVHRLRYRTISDRLIQLCYDILGLAPRRCHEPSPHSTLDPRPASRSWSCPPACRTVSAT